MTDDLKPRLDEAGIPELTDELARRFDHFAYIGCRERTDKLCEYKSRWHGNHVAVMGLLYKLAIRVDRDWNEDAENTGFGDDDEELTQED